ncbi:hypothetical protein DERP_013158 [Dermatophagoides pteronyssinus]|uniref:Major facilitator superfamily (MFS) profile domain-containing protein n=1 Tax=Dermatophagoides pteronyssinus TaxID=6956 RepID=A0ABQ8J386_DERPT|nr:hypothetical protein DERP_013158 [Dermatophagoides pteronyssinus]
MESISMNRPTENVDKQKNIDNILASLGNIGYYQIKTYLLCLFLMFCSGIIAPARVFELIIPEHRCLIPICENYDDIEQQPPNSNYELFHHSFLKFTLPKVENSYDRCHSYEPIKKFNNNNNDNQSTTTNEQCSSKTFELRSTIEPCKKFIFNHQYFQSTIITEFQLYCQQDNIQLIRACYFYGTIIGLILNIILADKYGRQIMIRIFCPLTVLIFILNIFVTNIYSYGFCLFFKGICSITLFQISYTLIIECLGGKWRFYLTNFSFAIFILGNIYTGLCAWWLREWKLIEISGIIPVLFLLPYPFILPESLRWEFAVGKHTKAIDNIDKAVRMNGNKIDNETIESFLEQTKRMTKSKISIGKLFTNKSIRLFLIIFLFIRFINAIGTHGISSFLSSSLNEDNIYILTLTMMIIELSGVILSTLIGGFSRKFILMIMMIMAGCFCIVCSFIELNDWKIIFVIICRICLVGSVTLAIVYSAELFPTILRISGVSFCALISKIGSMAATHLIELHSSENPLPFIFVGILTIIAGLLIFILPETKNRNLPDLLEN